MIFVEEKFLKKGVLDQPASWKRHGLFCAILGPRHIGTADIYGIVNITRVVAPRLYLAYHQITYS